MARRVSYKHCLHVVLILRIPSGYDDGKVQRLTKAALAAGFNHFKVRPISCQFPHFLKLLMSYDLDESWF